MKGHEGIKRDKEAEERQRRGRGEGDGGRQKIKFRSFALITIGYTDLII